MPNLIKYHIYVTFPGVGELEVFPKNNQDNDPIKYGWERTNDVWRKKVDTKLWFINEPGAGIHTFDIFASLELEECGCHRVDMRITIECGEGEELLYTGILFFIDGEWFFDFCSVSIGPRVNDPFECLFKNWETEKNVLIGPGLEVILNVDSGNYEIVTCTVHYFGELYPGVPDDRRLIYEDGCLAALDGNDWQVQEHMITTVGVGMDHLIVQTTWIRETFIGAGPPPGSGWTQATPTLWTRPLILQGPIIEEDFQSGVYLATWTVVSGSLDNGRLLSDVLIYLFDSCNEYPLRSDFLGIDPDGSAPANAAYAYAAEWIHDAVMFQMSDVVRPAVFQNATRGFTSLKKLLDCLRMNWRAFLYFDEDNQVYRIEHNSFERHANLINLVIKRPDAIRGYNTYTYDKTKIPQKETFSWSFRTNQDDWDAADIVYEDCNDVGNVKDYKIDCYHTDFQSLFESDIQDIDLLKGLMIVSQKDGEINRGIGEISGLIKANAGLSWANVVRYLWRWRMPSCAALVNGVERDFLSLIPKIRQRGFQAELCCMDILRINPAIDRVRTGLGNGEIEPFDLDLATGLMNFDLLFAPPIVLVPDTCPCEGEMLSCLYTQDLNPEGNLLTPGPGGILPEDCFILSLVVDGVQYVPTPLVFDGAVWNVIVIGGHDWVTNLADTINLLLIPYFTSPNPNEDDFDVEPNRASSIIRIKRPSCFDFEIIFHMAGVYFMTNQIGEWVSFDSGVTWYLYQDAFPAYCVGGPVLCETSNCND